MKALTNKYFKFMKSELKNRSIYENSIANGLSIYETNPVDNKATIEFDKFIEELQQ